MRILFIDPPGLNLGVNSAFAYLASILEDDVFVLDPHNRQNGIFGELIPLMDINRFLRILDKTMKEFNPDIIGISVKTATAKISKQIMSHIKDKTIIAGGIHIALEGEKYLTETAADIGIVGEGELIFKSVIDALKSPTPEKNLAKIKGIYYKTNNKINFTGRAPFIEDLDGLPFPDYSVFDSVKFKGGIMEEYPLLSSRGCPYNCKYCSMFNVMGKKFRYHSPEHVINELKHAKEKYKISKFSVLDDNFTFDTDRAIKICNLLIKANLGLTWYTHSGVRADRLTQKLLHKMKQSGCIQIWLGVESVDEKVFDTIDKGEKFLSIVNAIKMAKKAQLKVNAFFIIGLPKSTLKSDLKSVKFAKEMGISGWWFMFVPFPHTDFWNWAQENASILDSGGLIHDTNEIKPVIETKEYSKSDRIKAFYKIHLKMGLFERLGEDKKFKNCRVFLKALRYDPITIPSFLLYLAKKPLRRLLNKNENLAIIIKQLRQGKIKQVFSNIFSGKKIINGNWFVKKGVFSCDSPDDESIILWKNKMKCYNVSFMTRFLTKSTNPPLGGMIFYTNYSHKDQYTTHVTIEKDGIELWKTNNPDWEMVGKPTKIKLEKNKWYKVKLHVKNNSFECRIDDVLVTDKNYMPNDGLFGIGVKFCEAEFKDVEIENRE